MEETEAQLRTTLLLEKLKASCSAAETELVVQGVAGGVRGLSLDPPALAGIGNVKDMKRLNNHDMDTEETKPRKYIFTKT